MEPQWQLYREPLRSTLLRTVAIAAVVGAVMAGLRGGVARWPMMTLLALWPALGGHFVELCFLNWLRPRLSIAPAVQAGARLGVWFLGGAGLAMGMGLTAMLVKFPLANWDAPGFARRAALRLGLVGGLAFIGIELVVHLALQLRGRPSFYNGRG